MSARMPMPIQYVTLMVFTAGPDSPSKVEKCRLELEPELE